MGSFERSKSNESQRQGQAGTLPLLRILGLTSPSVDQVVSVGGVPPVNLAGFTLNQAKDAACFIPTLSRDGHVSFVFAASTVDDFYKMQEDVSARFVRRLGELPLSDLYLNNFLVVGFTLAFPEDPSRMFLVYETFVSPEPIPELIDVYNRLKSVSDGKSTVEVESYFTDGMRKKWLNEFIEGLERLLNWPQFVANGISTSEHT